MTSPNKAYAPPDGTHQASVGLAAQLCVQNGCDYTNNTSRIDLKWLESTNKGVAWSGATALANSSLSGKYLNDSPSPIFFNSTTRFVIYNGWQGNYANYRHYLATGPTPSLCRSRSFCQFSTYSSVSSVQPSSLGSTVVDIKGE